MTVGEVFAITVIIPLIIGLAVSALIALIPACIAKNKGRSIGLWWLYGFFLFWIALIHALLMSDKNAKPTVTVVRNAPSSAETKLKMLKQYKELLDSGAITQEEFEEKKKTLFHLLTKQSFLNAY